ncbi:MAG: glycosyltransferase family 2 protein [Candidatus Glassbacteria bacterium]
MGKSISIILPAYNEEQNIARSIEVSENVLKGLVDDYEIIVVNDGSLDRTEEVVSEISQTNSNVRCLSHRVNKGYGAALKTGLKNARKQLLFFTDSDLQFDISELKQLMSWIDTHDIVIGYRKRRRDHTGRRFLGWGWTTLVSILFGLKVRDIDCAFKLFKKKVIDSISIDSIGAFVNSEILLRATRMGYSLKEVPVTHFPRLNGKAKGARPRIIIKALHELSKMYRELS